MNGAEQGAADRLHKAFEAYRASISDLENFLITSRALDDTERAAGYRFILGLNKWVTDHNFLSLDTTRPRFVRFTDEFSQWGLANPDNSYFSAAVDGAQQYVISGRMGGAIDACIELRTGTGRKENGEHSRTLGYVDVDQLVVDDEGNFQVHIGGPEGSPNHIPNHPEAELVFVRFTYADWDNEEPATVAIELAGPAPAPAPPPSPELVALQMENVARQLNFMARVNDAQVSEFRKPLLVNGFAAPAEGLSGVKSKTGAFPGQHNALAWWELPPGQALLISLPPPACRYLGFMIGHPIWFYALDFHNRQNSLNMRQAQIASDGLLHYVISNSDPGVPNWIDAGHLREGFMFFRCQGLQGSFTAPTTRLVPVERIREFLPADVPATTPQERRETLKRRRHAVQKRFL